MSAGKPGWASPSANLPEHNYKAINRERVFQKPLARGDAFSPVKLELNQHARAPVCSSALSYRLLVARRRLRYREVDYASEAAADAGSGDDGPRQSVRGG